MTQPDDRLLDQVAWLRLLFAHMAGRGVRARVDIDDLVQEAVLRAFRVRETLPTEEDGLRRYLMAIARNCVFDVLRAARRRTGPESQGRIDRREWTQVEDPAAWTAGPATRVANLDRDQRLQAAFLELSSEHRRVLGLRQLEGRSADDTGRRMGRSATAIHSLYRRALAAWAEKARQLGVS